MKNSALAIIPNTSTDHPSKSGFTIIELLVVAGLLVVLAAMLLPALASTKERAPKTQCVNNLRQLTLSWLLYAADNTGKLAANGSEGLVASNGSLPKGASWADGILGWSTNLTDNTNTIYLTGGLLGRYNGGNIGIYKCPADRYPCLMFGSQVPRVRSISMNGFIEGGAFGGNGRSTWFSGYVAYDKLSDIKYPSPANLWLFMDEHPDSINDGWMMVLSSENPTTWEDIPAGYHNNASGMSFADGHAVTYQWRNLGTLQPVRHSQLNGNWPNASGVNQDLQWILPHSTVPY